MNSVFMWSGRHFGFLDGDDLWSLHGKHIGRKRGTEIYAPTGRYIGEMMANGRLTVNKSKSAQFGPSFMPFAQRDEHAPEEPRDTFALYHGYEEFPHPDLF